MSDFSLKSRIEQLKAMHNLMFLSNDEEIYNIWITEGIPDCPSEDDIEFCAKDRTTYNEIFDLFVKLIKNKGCRY